MSKESKGYKLPIETLPGMKQEELLKDLLELKAFLDARGIKTTNTRIDRYIQYLGECTNGHPEKAADVFKNSKDQRFRNPLDWGLYVLREVHELMWILKGLKAHIPKGIDAKLSILVSGTDFAALDSNTQSRNVQFELRIASYFCQTGCQVDLSTETDLIATFSKLVFYGECKRVANQAQLHRRVSEAKRQLYKRRPEKLEGRFSCGFIALDVTRAAFSHNGLTWALTPDHSKDIIQNKLKALAATIPPVRESRPLIHYWLQIRIPSLVLHPRQPITRFSSYWIQNETMDNLTRAAFAVFHHYILPTAIKPDPREEPPQKLTLRESYIFPAGTSCWFEEDALQQFIRSGKVQGDSPDIVVARMTLDGIDHNFSLYELQMMLSGLPDNEKKGLAKNPDEAVRQLTARLYMQKYPYEEDQARINAQAKK